MVRLCCIIPKIRAWNLTSLKKDSSLTNSRTNNLRNITSMVENILSNFNMSYIIYRFADGSIKIIRPNGEELNQFTDMSIQRKDKLGNITLKN